MYVEFEDWTQGRSVTSLGTNAGAKALPFQSWRHFKEAFAPELIERAIKGSRVEVRNCLDSFGGSGTTALACQFLGVRPITGEVNPFLADLIEAKLCTYDTDALARDFGACARFFSGGAGGADALLTALPPTFVEPGIQDRWIFDRAVAARVGAILDAIDTVPSPSHRRLLRVLLGGILPDVSNIVVNGKGRRYRRGWRDRRRDPALVDDLFCRAVRGAIVEIHTFARRRQPDYLVLRGDSRQKLEGAGTWDLAVFSPPYPNSFDYTDVYNIELWMLGYLATAGDNRELRQATLSSHVQVSRNFSPAPLDSPLLTTTVKQLNDARTMLWDKRIPEMVGSYFAELTDILSLTKSSLTIGGSSWVVIGDSRYAGVQIQTAKILAELASARGWSVECLEPFRSMRASAQQGGRRELAETLLVLGTS